MALRLLFPDRLFRSPTAVPALEECTVCKKPVERYNLEQHTFVALQLEFRGKQPEPLSVDLDRKVTRLHGVFCPDCSGVVADMLLNHGLVK